MRKTVEISGKNVVLDNNAGMLIRYKAEFGADIFEDYTTLVQAFDKPYSDKVGIVTIRLTYIMAKAADKTLPPLLEWLEEFESFPIKEMPAIIIDMMMDTLELRNKKKSTSLSKAEEET